MIADTGATPKLSRKQRARARDAQAAVSAPAAPVAPATAAATASCHHEKRLAEPREEFSEPAVAVSSDDVSLSRHPDPSAAASSMLVASPSGYVSVEHVMALVNHLLALPRFMPQVLQVDQLLPSHVESEHTLRNELAHANSELLVASRVAESRNMELSSCEAELSEVSSELTLVSRNNEELEANAAASQSSIRSLEVELSVAQRRHQLKGDALATHQRFKSEHLKAVTTMFGEELEFARSEIASRDKRISDLNETLELQQNYECALSSSYEQLLEHFSLTHQ